MSVSREMAEELKKETKKRMLKNIQETMRVIISEHFRKKAGDEKKKVELGPNPLAH